MVSQREMKDVRSTGRRRARKVLFEEFVPYKCAGWIDSLGNHHPCGKTTKEPPKDAPKWFEEIWPEENRVLDSQLQADHETKDLTVNDVQHLNWRCPPCHKHQDKQTGQGIATVQKRALW